MKYLGAYIERVNQSIKLLQVENWISFNIQHPSVSNPPHQIIQNTSTIIAGLSFNTKDLKGKRQQTKTPIEESRKKTKEQDLYFTLCKHTPQPLQFHLQAPPCSGHARCPGPPATSSCMIVMTSWQSWLSWPSRLSLSTGQGTKMITTLLTPWEFRTVDVTFNEQILTCVYLWLGGNRDVMMMMVMMTWW